MENLEISTVLSQLKELGHSNREAKTLLERGKVLIDDVPTADGRRSVHPSRVTVRPNSPRITPGRDPYIVFRCPDYVVINKPAGWLSVRAPRRHNSPTITGFVYNLLGAAFPVHRLDEPTSGLMLVALNEDSQFQLKSAFEERSIERTYMVLASGNFSGSLTHESLLIRDRGDGLRGSATKAQQRDLADEQLKRARSHFEAVEALNNATLIKAKLDTGRTHQVRIHLAELKHPVLGDSLYGGRRNQGRAERLALHSCLLRLPASLGGQSWSSPLADDLEKLRRTLDLRHVKSARGRQRRMQR